MFNDVYFTVVLIFGIVLAAGCYAVRRLETRPARIASVLTALALLTGALVPVVRILTESAAPPLEVVAPEAPAMSVSPTVSADTRAGARGAAVLPSDAGE
ncbi:hypothetical protein [Streptomyces sp. NPDC055085]